MTSIVRQALHNAARHYAKLAHIAWLGLEHAQQRAFEFAVTGKHLNRQLCNKRILECHTQYQSHLHRARRIRSMMA